MNKYDKFDEEVTKFVFELADKLKIHIGQTGTINPKWYKRQIGGNGISFICFPKEKNAN